MFFVVSIIYPSHGRDLGKTLGIGKMMTKKSMMKSDTAIPYYLTPHTVMKSYTFPPLLVIHTLHLYSREKKNPTLHAIVTPTRSQIIILKGSLRPSGLQKTWR